MTEIRSRLEGTLSFVQASGSGVTWATGTSPASGVLAYVTNFQFTSASTVSAAGDRGTPTHNKLISRAPIAASFTIMHTGNIPLPASGAGASVPMYHLEFRASAPEIAPTGFYARIMGVPVSQLQFTEGDLDNVAYTVQGLAMSAWMTSGYLS